MCINWKYVTLGVSRTAKTSAVEMYGIATNLQSVLSSSRLAHWGRKQFRFGGAIQDLIIDGDGSRGIIAASYVLLLITI